MLNRFARLRRNASRTAVLASFELTALDHYREYTRLRDASHNTMNAASVRWESERMSRDAWSRAITWVDAMNHLRRLDGLVPFELAGGEVREVAHA